jgi:hypothetical protein
VRLNQDSQKSIFFIAFLGITVATAVVVLLANIGVFGEGDTVKNFASWGLAAVLAEIVGATVIAYKTIMTTKSHLPKVIIDFPISPSDVRLDSEKCTYKISIRGEEAITGKAGIAFDKGGWEINIPQDVSSENDTIELRLVEKSGKVWTTIPFYPYVTKQGVTDEDEEQ